MGRRLIIILSLVATLLVPVAGPAGAATATTDPPIVFHFAPGFGEIVDAGSVYLRAVALSDRPLTEAELILDGRTLTDARRSAASSREWQLTATVELAAGDHIAALRAVDDRGRARTRAWRFTVSGTDVRQHANPDAIGQSVVLSREAFPGTDSAPAAVLARADQLADALAGVPLAQHVGGPLLLTRRDALTANVAGELARVVGDGGTVHLLGGTAALSAGVEQAVRDLGLVPVRHAGADRYATAVAIARQMPAATRAFVASGVSFADALAASAPAAREGWPILLTTAGSLPAATADYLSEGSIGQAIIAGGGKVVGTAVAERLKQLTGSVVRLGGADRTATAALIVDRYYDVAPTVGVADGASMADALLGARHATRLGAPILLSGVGEPGDALDATVRRLRPSKLHVYGPEGRVSDVALAGIRRGIVDGAGAAEVVSSDPTPGAEVGSLDTIIIELDRELQVASSNVFVTLDGVEVVGRTLQGDFADTLVFQVDRVHTTVKPGTAYPVEVTVLTYDGSRWSHERFAFTYRKQQLTRGDAGSEVEYVQRRLTELGYWLGDIDGQYGTLTTQAVMAFEKVNGLKRDGVIDDRVRALLDTAERPKARTAHAYAVEVDKARQVVLVTRYGRVEWVFNTSTGTETYYTYEGKRSLATTPKGTFKVSRQIDGMRDAPLGKLWRPKYFNGGIALHGSTSVPAYPASHGCVRLTYAAIDWMWDNDIIPIGTTVVVY